MFTLIGCIKHVPTELSPKNMKNRIDARGLELNTRTMEGGIK